jgi:hypothetical protein
LDDKAFIGIADDRHGVAIDGGAFALDHRQEML